jgi:ABC-type lipoprotein export system ATPase subunit/ABC-type antimicrobial peptide transport system permease subunit
VLELKNITKVYKIGDIETRALNGVSVSFREKEFVAILGQSGSGKTTALNIIGGLDRYTNGDLIIKGKSTKEFKDKDWDAYRNNSVGFVFQSYNLITHLSIVDNVELGMTLSGVSPAKRRARTIEVLEQVGLKEHLHKKPNQLSGGQMQRVAIARALANDPEILLCDEPTGALDTETSKQIMDLIKKVAEDRLVIMVTHNPEIAEEYADRIVRFRDGQISEDSNPYTAADSKEIFSLQKSAMNFLTALKISGKNLMTKKGRTFLTAFASSIGIIAIAVVLSLSNGFQKVIEKFQQSAMGDFPIIVMPETQEINREEMEKQNSARSNQSAIYGGVVERDLPTAIELYDGSNMTITHRNMLDDNYMKYIKEISSATLRNIGYGRISTLHFVRKEGDKYIPFSVMPVAMGEGGGTDISSMSSAGLVSYPEPNDPKDAAYIARGYEVVVGEFPKSSTDAVVVVDNLGRIPLATMQKFGIGFDDCKIEYDDEKDPEHKSPLYKLDFAAITGMELKIALNDDYYKYFAQNHNYIDIENFAKAEVLSEYSAEIMEKLGKELGEKYAAELAPAISAEVMGKYLEPFYAALAAAGIAPSDLGIDVNNPLAGLAALGSINPLDPSTIPDGVSLETIAALGKVKMPEMGAMTAEISEKVGEAIKEKVTEEMQSYAENPPEELKGLEAKLIEDGELKDKYEKKLQGYAKTAYESTTSVTVRISGIIISRPDSVMSFLSPGMAFSDKLVEEILNANQNSKIVTEQKAHPETNILTGEAFLSTDGGQMAMMTGGLDYEMVMKLIGGDAEPFFLMLFPSSFDGKNDLLDELNAYNKASFDKFKDTLKAAGYTGDLSSTDQNKFDKDFVSDLPNDVKDKLHEKLGLKKGVKVEDVFNTDYYSVTYTDLAGSITEMTEGIIDTITIVLIAFAAISLIVTLIMIAIITYTSVLERVKEIGILRALGARKKDITRVFDAETFWVGAFSGALGIAIAYLLTIPINAIIENATNIANCAKLNPLHAVLLFVISTLLTVAGGHLPARKASKMDAVEALRSD